MEFKKKYKIVLNSLKPHFRTQRTIFEQSGGEILSAATAIVAHDSSLKNLIPLDILSDPVNLKKMWYETKCPIAIVFRECMDDWIAAFPRDDKLIEWDIICMPGRSHDLHRSKQLFQKAINCDFEIDTPIIYEGYYNNKLNIKSFF
jgi:hypothetical protein